jgi:hypothetical protein
VDCTVGAEEAWGRRGRAGVAGISRGRLGNRGLAVAGGEGIAGALSAGERGCGGGSLQFALNSCRDFIYMIYMLHMLCVLMIHIVMDIFEIMLSMFDYPLYVITIMLIYGIKLVRKMPIILTVPTSVVASES